MSSNAAFCSRCGYTEGEMSEEQMDVMRSRRLRDRIYHLSMVSYGVISVFVGGFGWFWWSSGGFEHRPGPGPFILMTITAVAYLVVRALLFRNRQKLSALRKKKIRNPG
jgi:hypothetical protein